MNVVSFCCLGLQFGTWHRQITLGMSIFSQAFQQKKGAMCLVNDDFLISQLRFFARS